MKESHEDLDRALTMLTQAKPPEGMEARIAGGLQERRTRMKAADSPGVHYLLSRMALVGAMAGICVMAALLAGRHGDVEVKRDVAAEVRVVTPAGPHVAKSAIYRSVATTRHGRTLRGPVDRNRLVSFPAPDEPLTEQELLLLNLARARGPALSEVTTSETVPDHGLGKNAILEISHEELAQLKTTLQLTPLRSTLPQPDRPGDTE